MDIPKATDRKILNFVKKDLNPSWPLVLFKSSISILGGGLISLFICGQFGFGFTSFAESFHHGVHMQAGVAACMVFCGVLFSIVPALVLRALTTAIQFRLIVRHKIQAIFLWTLGFGALLSMHGSMGGNLLMYLLWSSAAILSFMVFSRSIDKISSIPRRSVYSTNL